MTDKTDVTTTTAPERIWLQVDTGYSGDDRSEPFPADFDGVTWHSEEIGGLEVEYVRADELTRLRAELERERLRLAACGVVAMSDTPESAAKNRDMQDGFKSASCDDVARRVDECMELRAEVARLEAEKAEAEASQIAALDLVSRIRFALGDNGKRMQDDLIAYCAEGWDKGSYCDSV